MEPVFEELRNAPQAEGFYKGQRLTRGMTVLNTAEGRFDVSSIDARDAGELATETGAAAAVGTPRCDPRRHGSELCHAVAHDLLGYIAYFCGSEAGAVVSTCDYQ